MEDFGEVARLGKILRDSLPRFLEDWKATKEILGTAFDASKDAGVRAFLTQIIDSHSLLIESIFALSGAMPGFYERYRDAKLHAAIVSFREALNRIDVTKIDSETSLDALKHHTAIVLGSPEKIEAALASAQALIFFLGLSHHSLLKAFLKRPTVLQNFTSNAGNMLVALGSDMVPMLGSAREFIRTTTPFVEKQIAGFEAATTQLDRLFALRKSLADMDRDSRLAETDVEAASVAVDHALAAFAASSAWLQARLNELR